MSTRPFPLLRSSTKLQAQRRKRTWLVAVVAILIIGPIAAYPKITEEIAFYRTGHSAYAYGLPIVMMGVSNGVMTAAAIWS